MFIHFCISLYFKFDSSLNLFFLYFAPYWELLSVSIQKTFSILCYHQFLINPLITPPKVWGLYVRDSDIHLLLYRGSLRRSRWRDRSSCLMWSVQREFLEDSAEECRVRGSGCRKTAGRAANSEPMSVRVPSLAWERRSETHREGGSVCSAGYNWRLKSAEEKIVYDYHKCEIELSRMKQKYIDVIVLRLKCKNHKQ